MAAAVANTISYKHGLLGNVEAEVVDRLGDGNYCHKEGWYRKVVSGKEN